MAKKTGLGRGLGALIPQERQDDKSDNVLEVEIGKLLPRDNQPRKNFDKDSLKDLKASIDEYGIIQPIIVRKKQDDYEIIAGERRYRAAKLAGLEKVPVIIKEMDDKTISEVSLIENIQREDLNPVEEAESYLSLMKEYSYTQKMLSDRIGKSRSYVANTLRLLNLEDEILQHLIKGELTTSQGRTLLSIEDREKRFKYLDKLLNKDVNIRDIEKVAKSSKKPDEDPYKRDLEDRLLERFGTRVRVVTKKKGGKIEIEYLSNDDLSRILSILEV